MEEEIKLTEGTNSDEQINMEEIEIEELDTLSNDDDDEEDNKQDDPIIEDDPKQVNKDNAPKLLKERKELKTENQTLKNRLAELEFKSEVSDLKEKYGAVDMDSLKEYKTQYPTLPLEDVYLLMKVKQPKVEKESNLGVVGSRGVPATKFISYDKLGTLSQTEYEKARTLIDQGKLILKYN